VQSRKINRLTTTTTTKLG
jgi:hypothetical protein